MYQLFPLRTWQNSFLPSCNFFYTFSLKVSVLLFRSGPFPPWNTLPFLADTRCQTSVYLWPVLFQRPSCPGAGTLVTVPGTRSEGHQHGRPPVSTSGRHSAWQAVLTCETGYVTRLCRLAPGTAVWIIRMLCDLQHFLPNSNISSESQICRK